MNKRRLLIGATSTEAGMYVINWHAIETFLNLSAVRRSRELGHQVAGKSAASRLLRDPHGCCGELGAHPMAASSTTLHVRLPTNTSVKEFFPIATRVSLLGHPPSEARPIHRSSREDHGEVVKRHSCQRPDVPIPCSHELHLGSETSLWHASWSRTCLPRSTLRQ